MDGFSAFVGFALTLAAAAFIGVACSVASLSTKNSAIEDGFFKHNGVYYSVARK